MKCSVHVKHRVESMRGLSCCYYNPNRLTVCAIGCVKIKRRDHLLLYTDRMNQSESRGESWVKAFTGL